MENLTPLQDEFNDRFINGTNYGQVKNIVYDILKDMTGRNGLQNEWEQIDYDTQEEIIEKWIDIVNSNCA
jgi:hypothetical protein